MKKAKKLFAPIVALALSFSMAAGLVGCAQPSGGQWVTPEIPPEQIVEPPAPIYRVYSVNLQYNDKNIDGGVLYADKSAGTIRVTAAVAKDDGADGTVRFDSSDKAVATISVDGTVKLLAKGETAISATVGDKTHSVVLVVSDDHAVKPQSHTITINGGTASVSSAAAGEYVTLSTEIPEHKDFVSWIFPNSVTWINGNVFKMPDCDVEIKAEFADMLYTLNVVGAAVTQADGETEPDGDDGGYTNDGDTAEYAVTTYRFPYDTTIDIAAIDEPDGKIFVGWDYGSRDNRAGDMGVPEYSFNMPGETFTVWAVFSEFTNKVLTAGGIGGFTTTKIENGVIAGASAPDAAMESMNGYRITVNAGQTSDAGYTNENIQGSQLDSAQYGTQTIKSIFRNNGNAEISVEVYAAYYGNIATSGRVTLAAGELKTVYFTAGLGINKPWMGFAVRDNKSSESITVDMVLGMAAMYPKGDRLLSVTGGPEYVWLRNNNDKFIGDGSGAFDGKDWNTAKPQMINNKVGASICAIYGAALADKIDPYLRAPIVNMPAYEEGKESTTIYGKYINLANNEGVDLTTTLKIIVSTGEDVIATEVDSFEFTSDKSGESILFKLEIPRSATDNGKFYIAYMQTQEHGRGTYDPHNFCIQMVYNNCIGYEE